MLLILIKCFIIATTNVYVFLEMFIFIEDNSQKNNKE